MRGVYGFIFCTILQKMMPLSIMTLGPVLQRARKFPSALQPHCHCILICCHSNPSQCKLKWQTELMYVNQNMEGFHWSPPAFSEVINIHLILFKSLLVSGRLIMWAYQQRDQSVQMSFAKLFDISCNIFSRLLHEAVGESRVEFKGTMLISLEWGWLLVRVWISPGYPCVTVQLLYVCLYNLGYKNVFLKQIWGC